MQTQLIFLIGPPRSGSTMLQRMLASHSDIATHPEPHIITPLAHLGYFHNVDQAPYDHINAAEAIREFVSDLPGGENDYLDACRAYTDTLYRRMLQSKKQKLFLDKTPAYALVLSYLSRLYPQAKYIVLTRHPLAVLSSYANSFFEGDTQQAVDFNNILARYLPAMARFLTQKQVPFFHLRYEDLVSDPDRKLAQVFSFLGLEHQAAAVDYGKHSHQDKSYGDPKVKQHGRPTTAGLGKWAEELAANQPKLAIAKKVAAPLAAEDIAAWGYDKEKLFDPVAQAAAQALPAEWKWRANKYRLKRKVFLGLRKNIHHNRLGKMVRRVRYYCDVLLRD